MSFKRTLMLSRADSHRVEDVRLALPPVHVPEQEPGFAADLGRHKICQSANRSPPTTATSAS
jgi:hypothetical protein